MSETKNLRLFKHNEPLETNENKFDIDLALNQNWDKIEEFADMVNDKIIEIEDKDEEQDFNLQELQNEIKKDRENMINLEVEGQSIHIEDSSDLEGQLEVLGNVEQDVREGYNLLNFNTTQNSRVICNEDGSITINGQGGFNIAFSEIKLEANKTYKQKIELISGSIKNSSGADMTNQSMMSFKSNLWLNKDEYISYTPQENELKKEAWIHKDAIFNNARIKFWAYEGTEEKPYEQYGESPSPEYPSEIRAVGDNINLWDKENMLVELGGYSGSNGNKYDSTTRIRNTKDIELKKDTYTLSAENSKLISIYIVGLKKELSRNGDSVTFTLEKDNTIRFTIENTALLNTEIKLERGNKETGYPLYGQGSVEIKKTTVNYYNVKSYAGSQPPPVDENDWITITGNNTGTSLKYLNYFTRNLDVIVGEKYWIVAEIKNVLGKGTFNITSQFFNQGQFNQGQFKGYLKQIQDIKAGDVFIYQSTAVKTKGDEQGLRTFIELRPGESANITFRLSVLETEPNKSNWKYVPYKKETKILPIQKPMLEGDYFVKEVDGWKEVHGWKEIILNGQENTWQLYTSGTRRFGLDLSKDLPKKETGKYATGYCTHFKVATTMNIDLTMFLQLETNHFYIGIVDKNSKWTDVNALKSELQRLYNAGTPIILYYKVEIPTKLPCTPEQIEILDELDNFQTYKPVTNTTTDSIAKLRLKYIADTKTYIDNKTSNLEQQVSVINQLLSTTKTSSVLLDNLQKDIESEVL